ncbi:hypothetical protein SEA_WILLIAMBOONE_2 [Gordonia phage WilliamBoone]|nr:hypothetical protein SEA_WILLIAMBOONE_2 [Gordonia phage WilliamBoone]
MSPRDPFWAYRKALKDDPTAGESVLGRNMITVLADDLKILLEEHDELSTMHAYCTSCRGCARELDEKVEMEQHEDEMFVNGWGWQ